MTLTSKLAKKKLFSVKVLLKRLGEEGFFRNIKSLQKYEKLGIIPQPRRMKINLWDSRVYTQEEIDEIVKRLRKQPIKKQIYAERI